MHTIYEKDFRDLLSYHLHIYMYVHVSRTSKEKQEEIKITLTTKEDDFLFRNKIMSCSPSLCWPEIWDVF